MNKTKIFPVVAAALSVLCGSCAHAQDPAVTYPNRPIRIIVTSAPGGGSDFMGRLAAQKLMESVGQQVVVDGREGGVIAAEIAARAAPDGYTLLWSTAAALITNIFTVKALPQRSDFPLVGAKVSQSRSPVSARRHRY